MKPGDQAPATASAEAAEGGEEEQAAEQHRRHSGSGGNENKGSGTQCDSRVGRFPPQHKLQGNNSYGKQINFSPFSVMAKRIVPN